ncbi:TonB-dependent siderophore receptor [Sessilibacter corallicola]|uniref:TonB-dependent siderophore receptor n=1 Tax=Sessilibacter corallicola TaxID=2904075 RepID=A0ABQ0ACG7_9GAMM
MATKLFSTNLLVLGICHAMAANSAETVIEEITVYGTDSDRYNAKEAVSTTGFKSSLLDTARSIQVIPEQIILDQQSLELDDTLRNISGVQPFKVVGGTGDSFILRGFRVNSIYQDGFRLAQEGRRVQTPNVDHVEVVKGATALLYGQTEPGGVINVVTKRPEAVTRNFLSTNFDDEGQQYTFADFTGSFNEDETLLYRLVTSYEDTDTFREATSESNILRKSFSPSLTWIISDVDQITAAVEIVSSEAPIDRGTVVVQDANGNFDLANIPEDRRLGEDLDVLDSLQKTARIEYQHTFANDWKFESIFNFEENDAFSYQNNPSLASNGLLPGLPPISSILATGGAGLSFNSVPEDGVLLRTSFESDTLDENFFVAFRFTGEIEAFGKQHVIATGIDAYQRNQDFKSNVSLVTLAETGLAGQIPVPDFTLFTEFNALNIFDPTFDDFRRDVTPVSTTDTEDEQIGIYIQDQITLNDQWIASLGLRFDQFEREITTRSILSAFPNPALSAFAFVPDGTTTRFRGDSETELSPNAGLVFKPTETVSLYTSYSESFTPNVVQNTITGEAQNQDPSESKQFEVGVKGSFFDEALNFNVAIYDLELENVLNGTDPLTGAGVFNGEQESRGLEIDTSIQFLNGLNVVAAYAYTDAEISESQFLEGNDPQGVAENSASIWASYEFKEGSFRGLGVGAGAFYTGDRYADGANTIELDDYTLLEATAWYYFPIGSGSQVRVQAGVKNLTDEEYFIPGSNNFRIGVGQPRTVFASASLEF